jgi:23S rRNA (adenine2030-N6)-methyltransferase
MNYRHHFHAGNFADVMKHVLLVQLVLAMQRKDKGFLYLDTHAGRGSYNLADASRGDTLERAPEWPDGIGRLWDHPPELEITRDYLKLVRDYDAERGNDKATPRYYPGSPLIVARLLREQDRMLLCERQLDECDELDIAMGRQSRCSVQARDGFGSLRATLPPPEKRALVLIDPPFESSDEFQAIAKALKDGLRRLPGGVFAIWYPITQRARVNGFFREVQGFDLPPTVAVELTIAGENAGIKMRGCGLLIVNPPWQFEAEVAADLAALSELLALAPGGACHFDWVVPER